MKANANTVDIASLLTTPQPTVDAQGVTLDTSRSVVLTKCLT